MKMAPIGVFGYIGFLCSAEDGESTTVPLDNSGRYDLGIYYFYAGECVPTVIQTGQVLNARTPGWLNTENVNYSETPGAITNKFATGTKWFCIPKVKNDTLPALKSIKLAEGETKYLVEGDRIFFVSGTAVTDNGVIVESIKAVNITKPTIITATSALYALQFLR